MTRYLSFLSSILICSVAFAEPVYLDCTIGSGKETRHFSVKLDEATGKITHTNKNGSAYNSEGFFSANEITYQKIIITSGIKVTDQYRINRTDLSVKFNFTVETTEYRNKIPAKTLGKTGSCKIITVKKRKI